MQISLHKIVCHENFETKNGPNYGIQISHMYDKLTEH